MAIGLSASPASLSNTATQDYEFGTDYYYQGAYYRYAKFVDAVTYAEGDVLEWAATNCTAVTNDRSGGSALGTPACGVCLTAMTQNYYGFFQVAGIGKVRVKTDAGVSAGDFLVKHTVDGECDTMADTEEDLVFAVAIADDSGDYVAAGNWYFKGVI